jgi:hypothetical protein
MAYHNPEIPGSSYETLEEAEAKVVLAVDAKTPKTPKDK